jgi:hypothetical protein
VAEESLNLEDYGWAVEIVHKHFSTGLAHICDPRFLDRRYREFEIKNDPIYAELLSGMNNEALSKTFVSYWTIAHTLATQSRFWLEDAVAEIIMRQVRDNLRERQQDDGPKKVEVYSAKMLGAGYFKDRKPVADLGEDVLEHLTARSPWRVTMKTSVLTKIDTDVGEQERQQPPKRKPFQARQWTGEQNKPAKETDQRLLANILGAFDGKEASEFTLQCNLLVVDPDKVRDKVGVTGLRFVNPKTLSNHAARKQERVNLLRLYGYLVQERVYNDPKTIRVCVAELLPRYGDFDMSDRYPDYFSTDTYWTCDRLWKFIGVPYEVVPAAISAAAKDFSKRLIDGLNRLLPGHKEPTLFDQPVKKRKRRG